MVIAGQEIILVVYGEKYRGAAMIVGWLGVMQSVRLTRTVPSQAAMALGDTRIQMYATSCEVLR